MDNILIEYNNFSFFYGKKRILNNISFKIESGESFFIMGPNGSGKSTLLKSLLRLAQGKSTGVTRIAGQNIESFSQRELARFFAYAPQPGGRIPPFSVREFINLAAYSYNSVWPNCKNNILDNTEYALNLTNIFHLANYPLSHLSGGQRQIAYLAAALAQNAKVLLLDEPTAFLDPQHIFQVNELLKNIRKKKVLTLIIVTHELNQPLELGGKALVLRGGNQLYFGKTDDLIEKGILEKTFNYPFSYIEHPKTAKKIVIM